MTETSARRSSVWRRFRVSRIGVAIGIVVFLVLSGTGAYAYWATTTSMTNTATSGALGITGTWTVPITATFTNVTYAVPAASTAQYTVTNNTNAAGSKYSATSMPYAVAFSASGANPGPLSNVLDVWVWKRSTASPCSVATPPTTAAHWGGSPLPTASGALKPGESEVWCVRTGVDERSKLASGIGSVSISPSLIATLSLSTTSWTKASVSATGTQQTQRIYPAYVPTVAWYRLKTGIAGKACGDVRGNGGNNTDVIAYQCNDPVSTNQMVRFSASDTGYVKMVFRYNTALTVGVAGAVTTTGAAIQVQSSTATDGSQEWQLQNKGAGKYQIVNRKSGLCIEPDVNDTADTPIFKQRVCSDLPNQAFELELYEAIPEFASVKCTNILSGSNRSFKVEWTGALQEALTVQVRQYSTTTWESNGTAAIGSVEYIIQDRNRLLGWSKDVAHEYRFVNSASTVRASGTFKTLHKAWELFDWSVYDYLRCG